VINEVQSKKTVLHRVNGHLEPGKFTLLLGPSGSGKTSLVDILSGRKTEGIISGEVQYGGEQPTKQFLRAYTAYVEQFDSLIDNLTVYEMLMYTAELRNYYAEPLYVKASRVEGVMSTLGLTECRNTIIGSRLNRGISGGELKRTNIGLALVGSPSVLFLDEPSSVRRSNS
jgi:ATP-binding cassette, subfamily G (WHITE), member 2